MYINTPVGPRRAPSHHAGRVEAMSDAELLDSIKVFGFIDPFALDEALRRGIWRNRQRQGCTLQEQIERIAQHDQT